MRCPSERPVRSVRSESPGNSAAVAHLLWEQEVGGSNPPSPTTVVSFTPGNDPAPFPTTVVSSTSGNDPARWVRALAAGVDLRDAGPTLTTLTSSMRA